MMANKNPGNFANDREKASEAGRKGGQQGSNMTDQERNQESGRRGGQNQQSNQERGRQ